MISNYYCCFWISAAPGVTLAYRPNKTLLLATAISIHISSCQEDIVTLNEPLHKHTATLVYTHTGPTWPLWVVPYQVLRRSSSARSVCGWLAPRAARSPAATRRWRGSASFSPRSSESHPVRNIPNIGLYGKVRILHLACNNLKATLQRPRAYHGNT